MLKLKTLLAEGYDPEIEDLEGADAIMQYLVAQGKEPQLISLGTDQYIIWDDNIIDPEYPIVEKKKDWLYGNSAWRLREFMSSEIEDRFNKRFWEHPEPLYHGTPKENVESIKREGLKKQHKSRGLSNRKITAAVFTERSPDYCGFHYGPAVFEIDTPQMKVDGFMPYVTKEPNHLDSDVINFLAHKIGAWDDEQDLSQAWSEGTSEDTIILYTDIPPKYLRLL